MPPIVHAPEVFIQPCSGSGWAVSFADDPKGAIQFFDTVDQCRDFCAACNFKVLFELGHDATYRDYLQARIRCATDLPLSTS